MSHGQSDTTPALLTAARGGYQIQDQWLERWSNVFTASVLAIIGALVLTRII